MLSFELQHVNTIASVIQSNILARVRQAPLRFQVIYIGSKVYVLYHLVLLGTLGIRLQVHLGSVTTDLTVIRHPQPQHLPNAQQLEQFSNGLYNPLQQHIQVCLCIYIFIYLLLPSNVSSFLVMIKPCPSLDSSFTYDCMPRFPFKFPGLIEGFRFSANSLCHSIETYGDFSIHIVEGQ